MSTASHPAVATADTTSRRFMQWLLRDYHPRAFDVRFPDGQVWAAECTTPKFTLVLKHPGSLRAMFWPPRGLTLAESYLFDHIDIEGDLEDLWLMAEHLHLKRWSLRDKVRFAFDLLRMPKPAAFASAGAAELTGRQHSLSRDQQAIKHHYDVSNDFYQLWLDKQMVYTCAYFKSDSDSIDAAQTNKLDYICRKLRLKPGERLLDIGCGWGSLIIHAAKYYGVDATGITLSQAQVSLANQRIAEAGLASRCRAVIQDYRAVSGDESYDKITSVGMLEHVGDVKFPVYFRCAWKLLRPGGVFLNHGIALNTDRKMPKGPTFVNKYVFPDGELIRLSRITEHAEAAGFEVRDVESLREHYHRTCQLWLRRLEARADDARAMVGETTYRVWRLYLAISALGFRVGWFNLYQSLLVKAGAGYSGLPLTRNDWYTESTYSSADCSAG